MSVGRFVLGRDGYKPEEFALYGAELENVGLELRRAPIRRLSGSRVVYFQEPLHGAGRLEPIDTRPILGLERRGVKSPSRAATLADNGIPGPTADPPARGQQQCLATEKRRAARGVTECR